MWQKWVKSSPHHPHYHPHGDPHHPPKIILFLLPVFIFKPWFPTHILLWDDGTHDGLSLTYLVTPLPFLFSLKCRTYTNHYNIILIVQWEYTERCVYPSRRRYPNLYIHMGLFEEISFPASRTPSFHCHYTLSKATTPRLEDVHTRSAVSRYAQHGTHSWGWERQEKTKTQHRCLFTHAFSYFLFMSMFSTFTLIKGGGLWCLLYFMSYKTS